MITEPHSHEDASIRELARKALAKFNKDNCDQSDDVPTLAKKALNKVNSSNQNQNNDDDIAELAKAALNNLYKMTP